MTWKRPFSYKFDLNHWVNGWQGDRSCYLFSIGETAAHNHIHIRWGVCPAFHDFNMQHHDGWIATRLLAHGRVEFAPFEHSKAYRLYQRIEEDPDAFILERLL